MSELIKDMKRTKKGKYVPVERKMHWLDHVRGAGIYVIELVAQGEEDQVIGRYVGATHDFERRRYQHFYKLSRGKHECKKLQRAFNEEKCWVRFRVLEQSKDLTDLDEREQWWIDHLNAEYNSSSPLKTNDDNGWQPEREPEVNDSWESLYEASLREPDLLLDIFPDWPYDQFSPEEIYQGTYIYQD